MKNLEFYVREDLTKEQFEALANREPNLAGKWLYKYSNSQITDDVELLYPKFQVMPSADYFFASFADAEAFMHKLIEKNKQEEDPDVYYRHVIQQIPIGARVYDYGATWLYDGDGTLVDYSIVANEGDPYDTHYFGRSSQRQRFKRGDIVEVIGRDNEVYLSLLVSDAPDIEWCWGYYQRVLNDTKYRIGYMLDITDETCYLIDGPGEEWHSHVSPLDIMKPHFPVPEDIRREMLSWLEAYTNQKGPVDDDKPRRSIGWQLGEINETGIYIHFNESTEVPHLHIADEVGLVDYAFRIDNGEPYLHDDIAGILPDKLLDKLQEYLEEKEIGKTRWWYILREWNDDNYEKYQIPLDTPVPKLKK